MLNGAEESLRFRVADLLSECGFIYRSTRFGPHINSVANTFSRVRCQEDSSRSILVQRVSCGVSDRALAADTARETFMAGGLR